MHEHEICSVSASQVEQERVEIVDNLEKHMQKFARSVAKYPITADELHDEIPLSRLVQHLGWFADEGVFTYKIVRLPRFESSQTEFEISHLDIEKLKHVAKRGRRRLRHRYGWIKAVRIRVWQPWQRLPRVGRSAARGILCVATVISAFSAAGKACEVMVHSIDHHPQTTTHQVHDVHHTLPGRMSP